MNPIVYALLAYALTAVISVMVIGLIVITNNIMNKRGNSQYQEVEDN